MSLRKILNSLYNDERLLWGFVSQITSTLSGILILPIFVYFFKTEELAVYYLCIPFIFLANIIDFGFGQHLSRHVSYVIAKNEKIVLKNFRLNQDSKINYSLLYGIKKTGKYFYQLIALLGFTAPIFYFYFFFNQEKYGAFHLPFWILVGIVTYFNIAFTYYNGLLNGSNNVISFRKGITYGKISGFISMVVFVLLKYQVYAFLLGSTIGILVTRFYHSREFRKLYSNHLTNCSLESKNYIHIFKEIFTTGSKVGVLQLLDFIINRALIFFIEPFYNTDRISSYGIANQLLNFIGSFSLTKHYVTYPELTLLVSKKQINGVLYKLLNVVNRQFIYTYIVLSIGIFISVTIFEILYPEKKMLGFNSLFIALFIFYFLEYEFTKTQGRILVFNEVPFFKAKIISTIGTLILIKISVGYLPLHHILSIPILINAIFNYWYWPIYFKNKIASFNG